MSRTRRVVPTLRYSATWALLESPMEIWSLCLLEKSSRYLRGEKSEYQTRVLKKLSKVTMGLPQSIGAASPKTQFLDGPFSESPKLLPSPSSAPHPERTGRLMRNGKSFFRTSRNAVSRASARKAAATGKRTMNWRTRRQLSTQAG